MPEHQQNKKWPAEVATPLGELQAVLARRGQTVATAESCTGGLVSTALTHLPGSSVVFKGGVAAYANEVKTSALGVDPALLAKYGAVSSQVALAMAEGARQRLASTWGVAITGIAGPGGGTLEKPVGTVFVAVAGPSRSEALSLSLTGDREVIRLEASRRALQALIQAVGT